MNPYRTLGMAKILLPPDSENLGPNDVFYNFNELPLYSQHSQIQYPYATFRPIYYKQYYGALQIQNRVNQNNYYANFISSTYPANNFGNIDVQFSQPVTNLTYTTIGVDGGYYWVDIYQNGSFTQQIRIQASCGYYPINCHTNLSGYT